MKNKALVVVLLIVAMAVGGCVWAYSRGYYHALRGGMAQSEKKYDEAISHFKTAYGKNPEAYMVAHDIACCYALKGDKESCFHWLRIALKSSYADYAKEYAKTERDFDSVRKTPEFQALIHDSPKETPEESPGTPSRR
jgi:tetratricopeptide (TPR) repeat protein